MAGNAQPDIGVLLAKAYQEFVVDLHAALAELGFDDIARSDGFVFRALGQQPMTVSRLAVRLDITKQGAGQIVDDMEARGYVRRRPDPTDARARLIELAPRGRKALAAAHRFHQRYERRLVKTYGRDALTSLRAVLSEMAGGADEIVAPRLRVTSL